jgi:sugar transferase (PEP-CTERM/EpsH1 system associated)
VKVLFLTHRLPYPPNKGDRLRALHIVRTLSATTDLEVVSLAHDDEELTHADELRRLFPARVTAVRTSPARNYVRAAGALAGTRPITHCLLDAPGLPAVLRDIARDRPPDVVLAYCSGMARFAMEPPLSRFPLVLDFVDIDSQKWAALGRTTKWPMGWIYRREATYLGRFEAHAARRAASSIVVNERERAALVQIAPEADVRVVGLGVDLSNLRPNTAPTEEPRVVFCGVMNYKPNVEGVLWFVREVWPLIVAQRPEAKFIVVGSSPTESIRRLASEGNRIEVTGTVEDVREYLWGAAVSVAPIWTARGLQNKVLEALAAGLPTVLTPEVLKGLPKEVHAGVRVAASADSFAKGIIVLLAASAAERRAVAARASLDSLGWDIQLAPLHQILSGAVQISTTETPASGSSAP